MVMPKHFQHDMQTRICASMPRVEAADTFLKAACTALKAQNPLTELQVEKVAADMIVTKTNHMTSVQMAFRVTTASNARRCDIFGKGLAVCDKFVAELSHMCDIDLIRRHNPRRSDIGVIHWQARKHGGASEYLG